MSNSGRNRSELEVEELANKIREMAALMGAHFELDEAKSQLYVRAQLTQDSERARVDLAAHI